MLSKPDINVSYVQTTSKAPNAMILACTKGLKSVVKRLLELNPEFLTVVPHGKIFLFGCSLKLTLEQTPLQAALQNHQTEIVEILIAAGANFQDSSLRLVFLDAIVSGDADLVQILIKYNAPIPEDDAVCIFAFLLVTHILRPRHS